MSDADSRVFELIGVSKSFGPQPVINNLSVTFGAGLTLLLGANGAGKTTLLRICAGLSRPDKGRIECVEPGPANVGHAGHLPFMYSQLSVRENLRLQASLMRLAADLDSLMAEWKLAEVADRKLGSLSRGYQQRASLCRAFMRSPKLLFLDEPTSNLDDASSELFTAKLASHLSSRPGAAAVVATHDLFRLLPRSARVLLLDGGKVAGDSLADSGEAVVERYRRRNH